MAAACKAPWFALMMMLLTPLTRALVLQHSASKATTATISTNSTFRTNSTMPASSVGLTAAQNYCNGLGSGWNIAYTDQTGGSLYCLYGSIGTGSNCNDCNTYRIVVWLDGGGETKHDSGSYPFATTAGNVYSAHTNPCSIGPNTLGNPCDTFDLVPTPAPPTAPSASATGDPHLQNVLGEHFDLMMEGNHILIDIPRHAEHALLRVQADAHRVGSQCSDMYFQALNVTGSWADAKQAGGYHYSVSQSEVEAPEWITFGKVELKVVRGLTNSGVSYLNMYAKHLGRTGFAVGGLLGEADHTAESTPPAWCLKHVSLQKTRSHLYSRESIRASIAEATFE